MVTKGCKGGRSGWTRERHGTRYTSKQPNKEPKTEGPDEQQDVVNAIIVQDPKHHGEAVKGDHQEQ